MPRVLFQKRNFPARWSNRIFVETLEYYPPEMSLPNPLPEPGNGPLPYADALQLRQTGSHHIEPDEDDFSAVSERLARLWPPQSLSAGLLTFSLDNCRLG